LRVLFTILLFCIPYILMHKPICSHFLSIYKKNQARLVVIATNWSLLSVMIGEVRPANIGELSSWSYRSLYLSLPLPLSPPHLFSSPPTLFLPALPFSLSLPKSRRSGEHFPQWVLAEHGCQFAKQILVQCTDAKTGQYGAGLRALQNR